MSVNSRAGKTFLIAVILYIAASIIVGFSGVDAESEPIKMYAINALVTQVGAILLPSIVMMRGQDPVRYGFKRISFGQVLLSVLIGIGLFLAVTGINSLFTTAAEEVLGQDLSEMSTQLPPMDTPFNAVASVVLIAIIPAVTEEVLFRGAMLNSWRQLGRRRAIWLTSITFALMHVQPVSMPAFLFIAYFLGAMSYESGSTVPCMIAHFMNNAISLVLIWIAGRGAEEVSAASFSELMHAALLYVAIGLAILGISYGLFKQLCRKGRTEETDAQKCENVHMGMREAVPLAIACAMLALLGVASFMVTLIDFSQFGVVQ